MIVRKETTMNVQEQSKQTGFAVSVPFLIPWNISRVCCKQDCGYSCQDAVGLEDDPDLPSIPFNISVSERRCNGKMCEISWKIHQNKAQMLPVFFVVETRSHVGNVFSQRKLSPWQWCNFQKMAEVLDHATMIKK